MNAKVIRRLVGLSLMAAAPAALAGAEPVWRDASTGYAPLFDVERSRLDDRLARLQAEVPSLWTDAGAGFAALFAVRLSRLDDAEQARRLAAEEQWVDAGSGYKALFAHRPYRGPAAPASRGSPDGV